MDSTTINVEIEKINPEAEEASRGRRRREEREEVARQGKIIVCRLSSSFFFLFTLRDLSPFFHSTTNPKSLSLSCAIDNDATIMTFIHICCLLLCFVPLTIYLGTSYVNAEVESVAPSNVTCYKYGAATVSASGRGCQYFVTYSMTRENRQRWNISEAIYIDDKLNKVTGMFKGGGGGYKKQVEDKCVKWIEGWNPKNLKNQKSNEVVYCYPYRHTTKDAFFQPVAKVSNIGVAGVSLLLDKKRVVETNRESFKLGLGWTIFVGLGCVMAAPLIQGCRLIERGVISYIGCIMLSVGLPVGLCWYILSLE